MRFVLQIMAQSFLCEKKFLCVSAEGVIFFLGNFSIDTIQWNDYPLWIRYHLIMC